MTLPRCCQDVGFEVSNGAHALKTRKSYKTVTLSPPPPTTYSSLPFLCYLVFLSSFSHSLGKSKPLLLDELCNHPMNCYWAHFTQNSQSQEKDFGKTSKAAAPQFQSHPNSCSTSFIPGLCPVLPERKDSVLKGTQCGWPSQLTLRKPHSLLQYDSW